MRLSAPPLNLNSNQALTMKFGSIPNSDALTITTKNWGTVTVHILKSTVTGGLRFAMVDSTGAKSFGLDTQNFIGAYDPAAQTLELGGGPGVSKKEILTNITDPLA